MSSLRVVFAEIDVNRVSDDNNDVDDDDGGNDVRRTQQ